jgi:integrase
MRGARPLTRDEFNRVMQSFSGKYAERNRCLFLLGTSAMTRVSELAALTIGDVYQGGLVVSEMVLRKQIVKGKKESRIAVLPPETVSAIQDFIAWKVEHGESLAKDAPLFLSRQGGYLHRMQIHRILKDAYAKAGLTGRLTTHTMRKTGGTWLYEATGDLLLTQEALGHRSPETTRRYVPLNRLRMRQAMANFFTADSDKRIVLSHSKEKVIPFQRRAAAR